MALYFYRKLRVISQEGCSVHIQYEGVNWDIVPRQRCYVQPILDNGLLRIVTPQPVC